MKVLKTLVLTSNRIAQLEEDCFNGLEDKLQFLDMSLNTIPLSDLSKLQVLRYLQTLKLQNSGLTTIPTSAAVFSNKPNLQILDLRGNHFTDIPNGVFTNLSSLLELDLSENQIRTMGDTSFSGLTSLKKLDLGRQSLVGSSLTLPPLTPLSSLTTLNLVNTPLSTQSWNRISQATSMTTLNLRQTGLTSIPNMSFRTMTNLSSLDLGNNRITTINQETFVGPKSYLTSIDLSSNLINYFDSCTFHDYGTQLKLNLIGNPLHCDCHLYWLSKAVRDGQISLEMYLPNTCIYPSVRNGSDFSTLNPIDLCSTAPTPAVCSDYYSPTTTTTSTTTTTITTKISIGITVTFKSATLNSITISWTLDRPELLNHITISHIEVPGGTTHSYSREITPGNSQYSIAGLQQNTGYEICVLLNRKDGQPQQTCIREKTQATATPPSSTDNPTSNSTEIGLIIGSVIGGLVLIAILVAIIYLVFLRKKSPKEKYPVQPRPFTRSELPQMGYDSKRYGRKKKKDTTDGNQNQVTVSTVTDGKNGQPNLGRISAGSYQYLDEKQPVSNKPNPVPPYVNDAAAKHSSSPYENDVDMRPLPRKPQDSTGYYNPAFRNSTYPDQQPHTYTEIHL
ncbi:leucine-rich repeats and immunoglobulin-like domains protein 2 [Haliotis rubra]|uniref:leucine-rich repeats and immunoglobulin-like domains protein 2 n=1 Tax=Haliotis rubra TaxID=36100 RepID=UPI001EE5CBF8|nr:leucine-rich repeats and immunoglobulin-like domains protein 2 [Haliotis rubra]